MYFLLGRRTGAAIQESRPWAYQLNLMGSRVLQVPRMKRRGVVGDLTALRGTWSLINYFTANHAKGGVAHNWSVVGLGRRTHSARRIEFTRKRVLRQLRVQMTGLVGPGSY